MDERKDILALLKRNGFNRSRLDVLARCDARRCGDTTHCREVCPFGRERRRQVHSQSIARLLANETDLYEVRVSRASWSCGVDDLDPVTIAAVNNLNRRALDKIQEAVVAVGTVKVFAAPARDENAQDVWRWEIHEFVSCSSRALLEQALLPERLDPGISSYVYIRPVDDLTEVIGRVLTHDLVEWNHPRVATDPVQPAKKWRKAYYRWALRLKANDRLVRYGCDRYFNRLKKPPRVHRPPPKRRPYPKHLERHMFGNHSPFCHCIACGGLGRANASTNREEPHRRPKKNPRTFQKYTLDE
jgi:hypothetical protein